MSEYPRNPEDCPAAMGPLPSDQRHLEHHTARLLKEAAEKIIAHGGDPDEMLRPARLAFDVGDYTVAGITALQTASRFVASQRDETPEELARRLFPNGPPGGGSS